MWVAATGRQDRAAGAGAAAAPAGDGPPVSVWRSPVAWAVSAVLAFQSVLYYTVTTWLPTLLVDEVAADLSATTLAATLFQVLGIAGTVAVPALVGRRPGQTGLGLAVAATWAVLLAGLLVAPGAWALWSVVGGVAQGAGISLSFTLVVLRARHPDTVRRLSGMSQLVGYGVGAAGPFAIGAVYAATDGWTVPLVLLLAVTAAFAVALAVAGRRRWVDAPVFHGEEAPSSPSGGPGHRGPGGTGRSDEGA